MKMPQILSSGMLRLIFVCVLLIRTGQVSAQVYLEEILRQTEGYCPGSGRKFVDADILELKGEVRSVKQTRYEHPEVMRGTEAWSKVDGYSYLFNSKGNIREIHFLDKEGMLSGAVIANYNSEGHITSLIESKGGKTSRIREIRYGKKEPVIRIAEELPQVNETRNIEYWVNGEGFVTEQLRYDGRSGERFFRETYKPDEFGNCIVSTDSNAVKGCFRQVYYYDSLCVLRLTIDLNMALDTIGAVSYTYDEQGMLTERVEYGNTGYPLRTESMQYDDRGRLTELLIRSEDPFDLAEARYTYAYTYDEKGNWVRKTVSMDGKTVQYIEREIVYL